MFQNQVIRSNCTKSIKVLCQDQDIHDILGANTINIIAKLRDGGLQSTDNRLTLTRNSKTRQISGLSICLGSLNLLDLVSFGLVRGGLLETLTGIDLIHGCLDTRIGGEVRYKCIEDFVTVVLHDGFELPVGIFSNFTLGSESFIKFHAGHSGADYIENVGLDLTTGIRETVIGIIGEFRKYAELNCNLCPYKHIILCLCFTGNIQLLNTER
mmetsp:Transcript_21729/g.33053  ORF Transcript_21729/g.33053 Transcript_21729/m.33053 type:complete len:212 (+) Transcript_21729:411-1046(+)